MPSPSQFPGRATEMDHDHEGGGGTDSDDDPPDIGEEGGAGDAMPEGECPDDVAESMELRPEACDEHVGPYDDNGALEAMHPPTNLRDNKISCACLGMQVE